MHLLLCGEVQVSGNGSDACMLRHSPYQENNEGITVMLTNALNLIATENNRTMTTTLNFGKHAKRIQDKEKLGTTSVPKKAIVTIKEVPSASRHGNL